MSDTQKPVAWYLPSTEGYDSLFRDHSTVIACTGNKWEGWQPLYTTPPDAAARIAELERELERERMRLVACGVVALADTPESAETQREMHPDYRSASLNDVIRRVDECMRLRTELAEARTLLDQARMALEGWDNYDKWVWPASALASAKRNTSEVLAAMQGRPT